MDEKFEVFETRWVTAIKEMELAHKEAVLVYSSASKSVIDKLRAELTTAREPKWIPVSERLPEELKEVEVWVDAGVKWRFGYFQDGTWYNDDTGEILGYAQKSVDGFIEKIEGVTHWQPLPEPPRGNN